MSSITSESQTLAASLMHRAAHFIGGAWVPPIVPGRPIEVIDPTTEAVVGQVPAGSADDVDAAVAAARAAFDAWAPTPPAERGAFLRRIRDCLAARTDEAAEVISREMGAPLWFSKAVQVGLPLTVLGSYADLAESFEFSSSNGSTTVLREPAGVVGAITPWNYPLHQIVAKIGAALAAGCTVVLKPSELSPLCTFLLVDAAIEAGLPAGVLNVVTGTGVGVGEPMAAHPDIDVMSFTGSTRAGTRVAELAAATVKRVALELGGKSANVLLEDADFAKAVPSGVASVMVNSGQTCSALTRMLVPRSRYDEAIELAVAAAAAWSPGDPFAEGSRLGPVVSAAQRERIRGYISGAVQEGARVVAGGADAPEELPIGYFVAPTVLADVTPQMRVAREEVFGPVLAVIAYEDEAEALAIANDSDYGLSGGVWAADPARARQFASRMRTGQVSVNGGRFDPLAPFGGYKRSGVGRELGAAGLEEFLETKALLG